MKLLYAFLTGGILFSVSLFSQTYPFTQPCNPPTAKIDLDINNVRAALLNGADMWWDLVGPGYEIPKGSQKNSIFSGALWFGALDGLGNLMVAAQTYRQSGEDFWPGPLDTIYGFTNDSVCQAYDRFWKLNRSEVEAFVQHHSDTGYSIPGAILSWPGNGNTAAGQAHYLAPFNDADGDGIYNPFAGDYPAFALNGMPDCNTNLLGDQAIWWVFNDAGNEHSETGSFKKFGMEVHAMAFAFHTNDALNDATMYRYQVINRSSNSWSQMWMGQFSDVDLGAYDDDYVGCDVSRGMGYQYNGDLYDGTSSIPTTGTYGEHPPAIGLDFLQGPLADINDLADNDRDSILDETGERIKMSNFMYYDGGFSATSNPTDAVEFYQYLKSVWRDGTHLTYGNNGYGNPVNCNFMYPGNSDPYGWGTGGVPQTPWYETVTPYDRRFLSSAGPFTMSPGEVQTIVIGVPWARDTAGNNLGAITKLQQADDYIQQMFDNCFASLPCTSDAAPDFAVTLNGKTAYFTSEAANGTYSWDFGDNTSSNQKHPAHTFGSGGNFNVCFTVTNACGSQTVCHEVVVEVPLDECGPPVQRLEGKGSGNRVLDFMQESIDSVFVSSDQRVHFPWYQPLHAPVKITYENYVNMVNGNYRIAFDSTGFNSHWKMWIVGQTDTVYADSTIGSGNKQIIPQWGIGVTVQQVNLPGSGRNPGRNGFLEATMTFADPDKKWLTGLADNDTHSEWNWIRSGDFWGIGNNNPCGNAWDDRMIASLPIDANEDFESMIGGTWAPYRLTANNLDPNNQSNICYTTGPAYWSTQTMLQNRIDNISNVDVVITPDKSKWTRCIVFEIGSNTAMTQNNQPAFLLRSSPSVDKNGKTVAQGAISDVNNPEAADYIGATGMSWFPGYAINIETGERLNMAFGENSELTNENGRDMLWNPTSTESSAFGDPIFGGMHYTYVFGHNGDAHYANPYPNAPELSNELKDVPVYDAGRMMYKILGASTIQIQQQERTEIFRDAMWVNIPMLVPGHSLLETDAVIRLRVAKPFKAYNTSASPENNNYPLYGFKIDKLNLGCNFYDGSVVAYPNPFSETCTIFFDNTENLPCSLKLYDVRGRLVRSYENNISDRFVISSGGLEEGIYIYSLKKTGEKPVTGKIILR